MKQAPLADKENIRLTSLYRTGLLDSEPEERFDRLVRMAKQVFDVPIALVSLVDAERQWFKAKIGLLEEQTERCISFCAHAILQDGLFVVENTLVDERFSDNPLVTGELGLRFYAGRPIRAVDGERIGTLCILDTKPRKMDASARLMLEDLGKLVENEINNERSRERSKGKQTTSPTGQGAGKNGIKELGLSHLLNYAPIARAIGQTHIAGVIAGIGGLIILLIIISWYHKDLHAFTSNNVKEAIQLSSSLRGKIETELNSRLHLTQGLAGFVRANQSVNEVQFQKFANDIGHNLSSIRSLQLAPNAVVTHVWPYDSNRNAIGHDLMADPKRRAAAEKAIELRNIWLVGPLNLIQGGTAIIARYPIFLSNSLSQKENFWGFSTVLIDLENFISEIGLDTSQFDFEIAIRGQNGDGQFTEAFFGDDKTFLAPITRSTVSLPAGSWEIALGHPAGKPTFFPSTTFWVIGGLSLLVIPWLIFILLRLPRRFEIAVDQATRALELSEILFRDAIEALSDGFVIYDKKDKLVTCNQQYRAIYGKSRELIQEGRSYQEIVSFGYDQGQYDLGDSPNMSREDFIQTSMNRHRSQDLPGEELLESGRWIQLVERPIRGGGTVGLRIDITEQKNKQLELAKAKENAEAANRAKSAFLATVSHEVRTPMNVVLGLLELLKESSDINHLDKKYIKTAYQSANQLLHILNEILDLSKVEAGKLELERSSFSFIKVVNNVIEASENQAKDKNIQLNFCYDDSHHEFVNGDEGRLHQILFNIVNNAVKFTDEGEVNVSINQRIIAQNQCWLTITVADSGIGFNQAQIKKLFKPFSQIDNSASRRHEGTGLGLSICKKIVELMGGNITAKGTAGVGATFTVELPFELVDKMELVKQNQNKTKTNEILESSFRLLIAEDSPSNRIVFDAVLANSGYQIDMVENGKEAVNAVKNNHYDLVLMDIYMPIMNGIEATKCIRSNAQFDNVPIIALTANAMKGDQERFIQSGMDDYLPKPISKEKLIGKIEQWRAKALSKST